MKLSEVSINEIFIGMEVISTIGNEGKVTEIQDRSNKNPYDGDFYLTIKWNNGKSNQLPHYLCEYVTIKEK